MEVIMEMTKSQFKEIWWLLLLRGVALILFGLVSVVWPGLTLVILAAAFAIYLLFAGIVDIIGAIRGEGRRSLWFVTLLLGLAEVGVGVYILKNNLVLATFIAVLGISLMVFGILEIVAAFEPGRGSKFLPILGGALSLIAGFIVLRYPVSSGLTFAWVLGLWGLVAGSMQVAMCLALHSEIERGELTA